MARAIQTTFVGLFLGFLSTAMFLATFIVAGDVLIAATFATGTAITQFVLRQNTHQKVGVLIWASLALVIALTGLSLNGDPADAAAGPITLSQSTSEMPVCACHGASHSALQASITAPVLKNL